MRKLGMMAAGLVLLVATSVAAQQVYTGTVMRVDPSAGVIVFDDGRMLQTTADTVIISGNQRMMFSGLQSGRQVTVYQAQPVALRDGRYIVMSDVGARAATGTPVTGLSAATVPPPPPPPPASTMVVTPPATGVVQTTEVIAPTFEISGHVRRADPTGRVIVLTDGRKVHLTDDTQVLLNGTQSTPLSTLYPGSHVVIRSLRPFAGARGGDWVPMNEVARGTIVRTDQPGVLVLNDGRTIRTTADTVVLIDNRPVALTHVPTGSRVVIYQNGDTTAVVNEPAASPALVPEAGLKDKENDRQGQ